ncbi:OsmC family protein [Hoeflea sp. TYP-13]|uniref:OsmC family protein n=1 Tax=Hoeflea sp. TYP-13 TaxID=3230023 RepID=UPI0034C6DE7C
MTGQRMVESTWRGGLCCDVSAGEFVVTVDEPEHVGGSNLGPEPTALLLASVASCFTLAIAYSARKRSIALDDLTVSATGIYDGPRFRSISIESRLGCDPDRVDTLVQAAERVCYVTNTLRSEIEIKVNATAIAAPAP